MRWKGSIIAILVLVVLFLLISDFRKQQTVVDHTGIPSSDFNLTDRDKAYLDRFMDLQMVDGNLLCFAGRIGKQAGLRTTGQAVRLLPMSARCRLLILSLVAGFLCYEGVLTVMESEPIWKLRSQLTGNPVGAQMLLLALEYDVVGLRLLWLESHTTV